MNANRIAPRVLIGLLVMALIAEVAIRLSLPGSFETLGMDYRIYVGASRSWLHGGAFYPSAQLAGPYVIEGGAVLYPPIALLLFVPFIFLPPLAWWAIPIAITVAVVWHHRPTPWACVVILACLALSRDAQLLYWFGTPTIWIASFVALATVWGWPSVLVFLKPAVFPLAFLGVRDRRWWYGAAGLALLSLALWPMWFDWLRALANARGPRANVLYAISDIPLYAIPIVAWLGGARHHVREFRLQLPHRWRSVP